MVLAPTTDLGTSTIVTWFARKLSHYPADLYTNFHCSYSFRIYPLNVNSLLNTRTYLRHLLFIIPFPTLLATVNALSTATLPTLDSEQ